MDKQAIRLDTKKSRRKLSTQSTLLFIRQLRVLLEGNLPIVQSLDILSASGANQKIRDVTQQLHQSTLEGSMLSEAMERTGAFSPVFVSMIKAGEESGTLATVLSNYGRTIERNYELRKKLQTALVYPVILSIVSLIVLAFLLTNVVPSFVRLFSESSVTLPLPTRILLTVSEALANWGLYILAGLLLLTLIGWLLARSPKTRVNVQKMQRRIPFFRSLDRDIQSAKIAGMMALFLDSNVNLLHFLQIMAHGTTNAWQRSVLMEAHDAIVAGDSVHSAFGRTDYFSPVFIGMIRIGEESGQLSSVMGSISTYLDMEAELKLRRAMSLLEPVLIIVMSVVVGFIVLSITLPMFEMIHLYDI